MQKLWPFAGTIISKATEEGIRILDRLKSLIFYNSKTIKEVVGGKKGEPGPILEVLLDNLLQYVFLSLIDLGHFTSETTYKPDDFLKEVSMKNLAKLQARHKGAAVSDARDYAEEKKAMDSVAI
jgi:hypothetical protein